MSDEFRSISLDNGKVLTVCIGDILRHADWDKVTDDERFLNKHLFRVTGFTTLPRDGSPALLLRQIAHPMREYMYTEAQLSTKLNPEKYPMAKQDHIFIRHDVQFESPAEIEVLESIPGDMIEYIKFQEDPRRSDKFKSYCKK